MPYKDKNKDRAYHNVYNQKHKEQVRAQRKRDWNKHKEKRKVQHIKYYKEHKEQRKQYAKEYRNNPQNKEYITKWKKAWIGRQKSLVFAHYGNKCQCCGESQKEFLTLDHINGDGHKQRRMRAGTGTGSNFYKWIIDHNYPNDLQILCCNCAKGVLGYCPHTKTQIKLA